MRLLDQPDDLRLTVRSSASYCIELVEEMPDVAFEELRQTPAEKGATIASIPLGSRHDSEVLLAGKLFDDRGNRMSPSHATKRGRRYWYYVSQAILLGRKEDVGSVARVAAVELERRVVDAMRVVEPTDSRHLTPSRLVADGGYGSADMVGWLVDERGIEPHVNLIDKSERTEGLSPASQLRIRYRTRPLCLSQVRSCENIAARSPYRARASQRTARSAIAPVNATATPACSNPSAVHVYRVRHC
jgi:hypothetical protein